MARSSAVGSARDAASRYAWKEAFDLFASADAVEPLEPEQLDEMAECAWWIGKMHHCMALRERAYREYLKKDDVRNAACVAIDLAQHHGDLGDEGDATAWLQNASRLLEPEPEGAEHGWLHLALAIMAHAHGEDDAVVEHAELASELGSRYGDKDLFALGHAFHGISLVANGEDADSGLAMVEEATEGAVSGALGARATGMIYCMMISVNAQLADWQSAGHWTEAATRWCDRQAINGFPGICRVHRAEILRLRGSLVDAEEEARAATVELGSFNLMFSALAFRELGEVRLKMGDLDAAEAAFRQAAEMGVTPQPGLAQAMVQRGHPEQAATGLRRILGSNGIGPLDRAKMLPTQLEIAVSLGDLDTARAAADELAVIAAQHPTPAMRATADAGAAAVLLTEGSLDEAAVAAARARDLFAGIDLTYEAARASELLGRIHHALGDVGTARTEEADALATYEQIGACCSSRGASGRSTPPHTR
jgi:tetratricopeptide (TPR) repeat protein